MALDQLPRDIIISIPDYLHTIDDLCSLLRVSRIFYDCCAASKARLPPASAFGGGNSIFQSHPQLLIAGTARSVADWVVQEEDREFALEAAVRDGIDGLHDLCCVEGRVDLSDLRRLFSVKHDLIDPLAKLLDEKLDPRAGELSGYRHSIDIYAKWSPSGSYHEFGLLNFFAFCELFHHDIDENVDPLSVPRKLSHQWRIVFYQCCMRDCRSDDEEADIAPNGIFESCRRTAVLYSRKAPGSGSRLACLLLLERLIYGDCPQPFRRNSSAASLEDEAFRREIELRIHNLPRTVNGFRPPDRSPLCTIIMHLPVQLYRILAPGGREAIAPEIQALAKQYNFDAVAQLVLDAVHTNTIEDEHPQDLISSGEGRNEGGRVPVWKFIELVEDIWRIPL